MPVIVEEASYVASKDNPVRERRRKEKSRSIKCDIKFVAEVEAVAKRTPLLWTMSIRACDRDTLPTLFATVSDRLIDLKLHLDSQNLDGSALSGAIENMAGLKRLEIKNCARKQLSVKSRAIQELKLDHNVLLEKCICPSLKRLSMYLQCPTFNPAILEPCLDSLEDLHINFLKITHPYWLNPDSDAPNLNPCLRSLEQRIERMPRLAKLSLFSSNYAYNWNARIMSKSVVDVTVALGNKSRLVKMACPMLKTLGVNINSITSPCLSHHFQVIEKLTIHMDGIKSSSEADDAKIKLQLLHNTIADNMPQLKRLVYEGAYFSDVQSDQIDLKSLKIRQVLF